MANRLLDASTDTSPPPCLLSKIALAPHRPLVLKSAWPPEAPPGGAPSPAQKPAPAHAPRTPLSPSPKSPATPTRGPDTPPASQFSFSNYKTELCKNYEAGRSCKWGPNCCFAHGKSELRARTHKEELKSKSCRGFNESGVCSYGVRCQFLHFKDYRRNQDVLEVVEYNLSSQMESEPADSLETLLLCGEAKSERLAVFVKMEAAARKKGRFAGF